MGLLEWFAVLVIVVSGYRVYLKQEFWLDRQIAMGIKWLKSLFGPK
jgi:hypothetical protein